MTIRAVLINKKTGRHASTQNRAHLCNLVKAGRMARHNDGGLPDLLLYISKTRASFVKTRSTKAYHSEYKLIWFSLVNAFLMQAQPNKRAQSAKSFVWWLRKTSGVENLAAHRLTKDTLICQESDRMLKETYTLIRKMQS